MRTRLLLFMALLAVLPTLAARPLLAAQPEGDPKDKAALQKNGEAFLEAFHKGDAKALAAFWTTDGETASIRRGTQPSRRLSKDFLRKTRA